MPRTLICETCKKTFVTKNITLLRRFCSRLCRDLGHQKRKTVQCFTCKKMFLRCPKRIKERNYCSRKCFKSGISEENSPYWKEKPGYQAIHVWVRKHLGKASYCMSCGLKEIPEGMDRYFEWANIDGKYKRDIHDYISLCKKCHAVFDLKY